MLCLLLYSSYLPLQASPSLPLKEVIVGANRSYKKELKKHAIRQVHTTFLGMPIRKWFYQWGIQRFNPEKIKQDIDRMQYRYACKLANTVNEKEKKILLAKRDKWIRAKEILYVKGNWFMRKGEKPMAYNPMYVADNEKRFLNYLHSIGYLGAEVSSKTDIQKKEIVVTYSIKENKLYRLASIEVQTVHPEIQTILSRCVQASFLQKGHPYQYQNLLKEQERIITLLSNEGYFACNEQHVSFVATVSNDDPTVAISILIDALESNITHLKKTKIAAVIVDCTNPNNKKDAKCMHATRLQNIEFRMQPYAYPLLDLVRKITIRPGDWYHKGKMLETYERLHALALFESITILPKLEADQLVVYIHAKPYESVKLQAEFGGECVGINAKRLYPTLKILPTIRPLFKGLGMAQIEVCVGLGEQQDSSERYHFYDYMTCQLRYKFITSRFVGCFFEKMALFLENFTPKTTLDIGYSFFKKPMYNGHKVDTTLAYYWCNRAKNINYQIIPCNIIVDFNHKQSRDTRATEKELFQAQPTFLTTIGGLCKIENSLPINVSPADHCKKWMLSIGIEQGGLYEHFFPIRKVLSKKFQFYQYLKFDLAYRHALQLTQATTLVYQTKLGAIVAYNDTATETYAEKQYAIGGHGSVRAWDTQMIGPGSYERNTKNHPEKGDLLLLGNIELRQKLIGYLEGALFLDIGNTWKLGKHALPIMKFNWHKFYKEFAVSSGVGLRLNFYDIFVLCGDIAIPLHKPSGMKLNDPPFNFTISIDYPF